MTKIYEVNRQVLEAADAWVYRTDNQTTAALRAAVLLRQRLMPAHVNAMPRNIDKEKARRFWFHACNLENGEGTTSTPFGLMMMALDIPLYTNGDNAAPVAAFLRQMADALETKSV